MEEEKRCGREESAPTAERPGPPAVTALEPVVHIAAAIFVMRVFNFNPAVKLPQTPPPPLLILSTEIKMYAAGVQKNTPSPRVCRRKSGIKNACPIYTACKIKRIKNIYAV